jgi:anti-sigma B factor antagonist
VLESGCGATAPADVKSMLHLRVEHRNGSLVVTPLTPRLDAEAALELRARVAVEVQERQRVVVSLEHVASMDGSGLAALIAILKAMPPGGELRLAHVGASIRALLARTRLDELFPELDDAAAAGE